MGASAMVRQGYAPSPGGVLLSNVSYIPPGLEGRYKEPFSYNIVFANLATNVSQTGTVNIQNDSYFVCTSQCMDIWDAATGNTTNLNPRVASMLFRISDTSSGKYNMDQPTPIANQFGTADAPKIWLYRAKLYLPGGQIQMEITNQMAAAQRVRVTFEGFKCFNMPDELVSM